MPDAPRRRLLDRLSGSPSLLVGTCRITGDVEVPGALALQGQVIGDGDIGGELSIGAQAHWQGDLVAHSAVVAGRITGSIIVKEKIEIAASAVIRGRVTARMIAMERGATVEGEMTVTGNQPVIEYEEKRAGAPRVDAGSAGAEL